MELQTLYYLSKLQVCPEVKKPKALLNSATWEHIPQGYSWVGLVWLYSWSDSGLDFECRFMVELILGQGLKGLGKPIQTKPNFYINTYYINMCTCYIIIASISIFILLPYVNCLRKSYRLVSFVNFIIWILHCYN